MKTNLQSIKISFVIFMTICSIQIFGKSLSGTTTNVGSKAVKSAVYADTHTIKLVVIGGGWNIIRSFEYFNGTAWISVDDNDPAVSYTNFALHGSGFHESKTAGATAQFTFTGNGIRLKGNTANYCGTAKIYIDNVYQQDVTFYANPGAWDVLICENLNLVPAIPVVPPAPHTIKLVVIGGGFSLIQSFEYFNGSAWISVDDNDAAVSYTNFALANSLHESNTAGATAQFTFTGTDIRLKGRVASYCGTAKIYIDNIYQQDITFYSANQVENALIYEKTLSTVSSAVYTSGNLNNSGLTDEQLANTNITISSGEFIINATKTVRSLTVAPGAKLTHSSGTITAINGITLESNATGTATLIDSYSSPTFGATVKQYVTAGRNWYMSAPLNNNTANYSVLNKGASVAEYNEVTSLWSAVSTGTLTRGKGYVQVASATEGTTGTVSFVGTTNSGNVGVNLTNTLAGGKGFNLVGNPYPSYLSWSAVAADNSGANMPTGTMWYRTISYNSKSAWAPNTVYSSNDIVYNGTRFYKATSGGTSAASGGPTGTVTGITDNSVVWNYEGSIYIFATVNASGVASPATVSNLVPPMQAFWVKSTGGTLTFRNTMRSHNTGGTNALKAPKNSANDIKLIRLNVSNGVSADEAVIYVSANASNAFDTFDAPKYFNVAGSNQPEIYMQIGNEKLVINAMNEITAGTEIPLGFATENGDNFTISASEFRNFGSDLKVMLKDKQTATEFELTTGQPYAFSSAVANSTTRFSLIFRAPGSITDQKSIGKLNTQVFVNATNQITIIAPEKGNYAIFNAMGQLIEKGILNTKHETRNAKFDAGIYFVELSVNGQSEVQKVIIR